MINKSLNICFSSRIKPRENEKRAQQDDKHILFKSFNESRLSGEE